MASQQLLSLREASEKYNIPWATLRDAVYRGAIAARKIDNQWIVEAQSVEAFMANPPQLATPRCSSGSHVNRFDDVSFRCH